MMSSRALAKSKRQGSLWRLFVPFSGYAVPPKRSGGGIVTANTKHADNDRSAHKVNSK
jgi:hypothetical protein